MADYDLQYQDTHIDALLATANELKTAGYIYKGVATPSTNPGTPSERVAYLASEPGTYTNFGGIVITSGLYSLTYAGGTWTGTQMSAGSDIEVVQTTGQSTSNVMSQKAVTDEIEKCALVEENISTADLDISDENGYVLARFAKGHFQTKKFDSSKAAVIDELELYDFEISDENGNSIARFEGGHIKTKKFDSSEFTDKYVDCLGDSLTMGSANFGWFETKLQELLGSKYIVRNWGVGGENIATIMARLGAAQVIFPSSFVLPANGSAVQISTKTNPMTSAFNGAAITPLLQGASNDSGHKNRMVNPCYVNGIECTLIYTGTDVYANSPYTLQRNEVGSRDITFPADTPIYFNTGKQMGKSHISIVWMGTNGGYSSIDELVMAQKIVADYLSNNKYIFIGLHKLTGETANDYESKMIKQFGNKFFNIREYCCTNMIYDCGITPTSADLENMANGICPTSLLYDSTHFNPTSNAMIGKKVYELCEQLGYLINQNK